MASGAGSEEFNARLNHVTLIVSDLDAVCAQLERDGLRFEQPPTDMSCLWREARLRDPDGHQIRLYDAAVNRLDPPWRIDRERARRAKA